eukprot:Opistho-1_new@109182
MARGVGLSRVLAAVVEAAIVCGVVVLLCVQLSAAEGTKKSRTAGDRAAPSGNLISQTALERDYGVTTMQVGAVAAVLFGLAAVSSRTVRFYLLNWQTIYYGFRVRRELAKQIEKQKNFIVTQSAQLAKTPEVIRGFSRRHSNSGISPEDFTNLIEKKTLLESFKAQYVLDIINHAHPDMEGYGTLLSISTTPMTPFDYFHENGDPHVSFRVKIGKSVHAPSEFSESNLPFAIMPAGKLSFIIKPTIEGLPLEALDGDDGAQDGWGRGARQRFLHVSHTYSLLGDSADDLLSTPRITELDSRSEQPSRGGKARRRNAREKSAVSSAVEGADREKDESGRNVTQLDFPKFSEAKDSGRCVFTGKSYVLAAPFKHNAGRFEVALHEIEPVTYMFVESNNGERRCLTWIIKDIMLVVPCVVLEKITRKWSETTPRVSAPAIADSGQSTPGESTSSSS